MKWIIIRDFLAILFAVAKVAAALPQMDAVTVVALGTDATAVAYPGHRGL